MSAFLILRTELDGIRMDRQGAFRNTKKDGTEETDADLLAHVHSLGLTNVEDYVGWCARHGFSRRTRKHARLRLKERAFASQAAANARLADNKSEMRRPERVIDAILRGELDKEAVGFPYLKAIYRIYNAARSRRPEMKAFSRLLQHVIDKADFFHIQPVISHYGHNDENYFVGGLFALANRYRDWIRPMEAWRPQTHNARRQFSSLARHLFARWPVPAFMDSVWFKGVLKQATCHQDWFLHIGRGKNIRTADLPVSYTKRMAHQFLQAPSDFTVDGALRWGQIRALGGSEQLTRAVLATRLGASFENDDFWLTVFQFFIANPTLDLAHVGPIVDYIHNQRFVAQEVFVGPGLRERRPPVQPNFTMKGRTVASLLRQVDFWHGTLRTMHVPKLEWHTSGIEGFELVEGTGGTEKTWTITELCSTRALVTEGRLMNHCVATYFNACRNGSSSIWTLEVQSSEGKAKVLTIEVDNLRRSIRQARGKRNALPGEKYVSILRRWGQKIGLQVPRQL